jgi:hypothetical protein
MTIQQLALRLFGRVPKSTAEASMLFQYAIRLGLIP